MNQALPEMQNAPAEAPQSAVRNHVPVRLPELDLLAHRSESSRRRTATLTELDIKYPFCRLRSQPRLRWGEQDKGGIGASGWSPSWRTTVTFVSNTMTSGRVTLIIEPSLGVISSCCLPFWPMIGSYLRMRGVEAQGFFFVRNPITGKVDVMHRVKTLRKEKEERRVYRDCTFVAIKPETSRVDDDDFGGDENPGGYSFTLTSQYSDKQLHISAHFSKVLFKKVAAAVDIINEFLCKEDNSGRHTPTASRIFPTLSPLNTARSLNTGRLSNAGSIRLEKERCAGVAVVRQHPSSHAPSSSMESLMRRVSSGMSLLTNIAPAHVPVPEGRSLEAHLLSGFSEAPVYCTEAVTSRPDTNNEQTDNVTDVHCGGGCGVGSGHGGGGGGGDEGWASHECRDTRKLSRTPQITTDYTNSEVKSEGKEGSDKSKSSSTSEKAIVEAVTAVRVKPRPLFVTAR
jgi:hypothetical protein